MSEQRRSHFFLFPFFFFLLFLDFLRPPGMTGFIAGGLVGDGAEASVVVAAAAGASAAGAGTSAVAAASACGGIACLMSCLSTGVGGAPYDVQAAVEKQDKLIKIDKRSASALRLWLTIVLSQSR